MLALLTYEFRGGLFCSIITAGVNISLWESHLTQEGYLLALVIE